MLDIKVTQGSYWNGSQIPYWLYMVFTIFPLTGLFGIDHLLLRSPITALLKFLSLIPLLGFWYFYDIAQASGERELLEKYGLAVPFYGPLGIGAGIFNGSESTPAPSDSPRPWRYLLYVMTTYISILFPLNKLVLGDYAGAIAQFLMFVLFPLTFLAIIWSFYDMYRVTFDTEGIFDDGPSRFFPASWLLNPNFDRSVLGPKPYNSTSGPLNTIGRVINLATEATLGTGEIVVKGAQGLVQNSIDDVTDVVDTTADVTKNVVKTAGTVAESVTKSLEEGAHATEKLVKLVDKLPTIADKIATDLPNKIAQQSQGKLLGSPVGQAISGTTDVVKSAPLASITKAVAQAGGAFGEPSISTAALLFSVGILAFSGYVFYTLRNTLRNDREKSDEPPRDSGATRVPSEATG
jgi:hypothetical protein